MPHPSLRWLTGIGTYLASPYAFAILALYGIVWAFVGDLDFHGFATLATWMMTLFIQRTEHRDTQAIHAKLDELLHTQTQARNSLTRMDDEEPEDIERFRENERKSD